MDALWHDLRYGWRSLVTHRGVAAVAVVTLALGIGANAAIFSVVEAVLLRPLPFPEPGRLIQVWNVNAEKGWTRFAIRARDYTGWRQQSHTLEQLGAYRWWTFTLTGGDEPQEIPGNYVSSSLFTTLGVSPMLGRTFSPDEEQPSGPQVVVVSHGLWQRRFGGNPGLINQTIILDGRACTVVGIMPPGFEFPLQPRESRSVRQEERTTLWAPLVFQPAELQRGGNNLSVVGRLKVGLELKQAQTELEALSGQIEPQGSAAETRLGVRVVSLAQAIAGDVQSALLMLLGAVGFVLLIACANVGNLLLARSAARRKEFAIRRALGASRWRLITQLLTESALLGVMGGTLGLLLAWAGIDLLVAISPINIPRVEQISINGQVLAFTLVMSLITGLLFGLAPAFHVSRGDLNEALKDGSRQTTASRGTRRIRHMLVVTEVALALVLLIGAGLMIQSFARLYRVDSGINTQGVLAAGISLSSSQYRGSREKVAFSRELLERIRALPEVQYAGVSSDLPLRGGAITESFSIEGRSSDSTNVANQAGWYLVSSDYFRALGVPLLQGRDFTEQDSEAAPRVVIINQVLARRFWPGEDAIGRRLKIASEPPREIVGVAGDTRHMALDKEAMPEMYVPYAQAPYVVSLQLVVRTPSEPKHLAAAVRDEVLAVNPNQPVSHVKTMEQYLDDSVAHPRFRSILLGLFGALALVLAMVGLYGVMSYAVTQRTHEIGIRMALGARSRDVRRLVLKQGLGLTLLGVVIGLAGALSLTRVLKTFLFQVSATDPLTLAVVSLLLILIALLACLLPVRRAMAVDPMVALRYE